jgi:group I intron endonuclease
MKPRSIEVDKKEKGLVYYCYNKLNGKIYIGYTLTTLSRRIISHYHISKHNRSNNYFKNCLAKYPKDVFEWGVLYCSNNLEELKNKEIYFIKLFDSNNRENGYNLTSGGEQCYFNEEVKLKISKKAKERNLKGENNPFYNKKHTNETKEHLSNVRKGKCNNLGYKHSKETKEYLSKKKLEYYQNEYNIEKMRKAQKNKPIKCLNNDTIYYSTGEAASLLNINKNGIKAQLQKRIKKYKGYEFQFI